MGYKILDVSFWQGKIDFKKLSKTDVKGLIIKCGGSDDGLYKDSCFDRNYAEAKKYGFLIGAYYFAGSDFINDGEGILCAKEFLKITKDCEFDLPVFIDVEITPTALKNEATQATVKFCKYIEKHSKYKAGVYASAISGFKDRLNYDDLNDFSIWVADWGNKRGSFPERCDIWQYSSVGTISGIGGHVDMNVCYINPINNTQLPLVKTEKMAKVNVNNVHNIYKRKYSDVAYDVLQGKYGDGETRKRKLIIAGYDYNYVQALVNANFK